MKGVIVVGNNLDASLAKSECAGAIVIGADKGARYCYQNGIGMDYAVGDFDSLSLEEKRVVLKAAKQAIVLDPVKDDTDTAHALGLLENCDDIVILGGIAGRRIEHFLANIDLLCLDSRICLKDNDSCVCVLEEGKHKIEKGPYRFFSFFALLDSLVSFEGFAYPLSKFKLKRFDPLGVSNELINQEGILTLEEGKLLLVCSKSDS